MSSTDRLSSQSHEWYGAISSKSEDSNDMLRSGSSSINDDSENQEDYDYSYTVFEKNFKKNIGETVRQRQQIITCISTILWPITCPVWISIACLCNTCMICLHAGKPRGSQMPDVYRFSLCFPPYENECTLMFCSVFNPCHCDSYFNGHTDDTACIYAPTMKISDYATGPERQVMGWKDLKERMLTLEEKKARKTKEEEAKTRRGHEIQHAKEIEEEIEDLIELYTCIEKLVEGDPRFAAFLRDAKIRLAATRLAAAEVRRGEEENEELQQELEQLQNELHAKQQAFNDLRQQLALLENKF